MQLRLWQQEATGKPDLQPNSVSQERVGDNTGPSLICLCLKFMLTRQHTTYASCDVLSGAVLCNVVQRCGVQSCFVRG